MTFETNKTSSEPCESPAAGPAPVGGSAPPAAAARESLSWIRALASEWEDDRSGPSSAGRPD